MNKEIDIFKRIWDRIPTTIKVTFTSGMVAGILTHMYILTHKLPMWDDMNSFRSNGMSKILARWMLDYVDWISGYWSVPWINGLITIIFVSIAACFVVAVLKLRTVTSAVLIPIMMVTFPSIASTMGFTFTTDSYAFGIMMACIAAYAMRQGRYGFIWGIVCMCMSLGCYQAYLPLAASILVLSYILDVFDENKEIKTILISGVKTVVSLVTSLVIYIKIANFLYPNMPSNNGVDQMGKLDIAQIPELVIKAYKSIIKYFVYDPFSFVNKEMYAANVITVVLCIVSVGILLFISQTYKDKLKVVLLVVLGVLFPMVMAAIYIMAPTAAVSMLMLYAYVVVYVTLIALWEKIVEKENLSLFDKFNMRKVYSVIVVTCIIMSAHSNFIINNEAYFRSSIAYERVKDYFSRMMCRVEAMEGYQYGEELAVIGEFCVLTENNTNPLSVGFRIDDQKFADFSGIALENGMMTSGSRDNFLRIYLGINMPYLEEGRVAELQKSEEFAEMPNYPAEGSIKQIDGVWVVKLVQDWEIYQEEYLNSKK